MLNLEVNRRAGSNASMQVFEWRRRFMGVDKKHRSIALRGHLLQLDFDTQWRSWSKVQPKDLIRAARVSKSVRDGMRSLQQLLQNEARAASAVVLWLDCDREGENIAAEARDASLAVNNNMKILRARFRCAYSTLHMFLILCTGDMALLRK